MCWTWYDLLNQKVTNQRAIFHSGEHSLWLGPPAKDGAILLYYLVISHEEEFQWMQKGQMWEG